MMAIKNSVEDMLKYVEIVAKLAKEATGEVLFNKDSEHATVIFAQIFKSSIAQVCIYTGCLDEKIHSAENVITAAISFLETNKNAKLRIVSAKAICPEKSLTEHGLIKAIKEKGLESQLEIQMVKDEKAAPLYHFAVGDGKYFRYEPNSEKEAEFSAIVKFGEPEFGSKLQDKFNELSKNAVIVLAANISAK